jgi:hypothetical protein
VPGDDSSRVLSRQPSAFQRLAIYLQRRRPACSSPPTVLVPNSDSRSRAGFVGSRSVVLRFHRDVLVEGSSEWDTSEAKDDRGAEGSIQLSAGTSDVGDSLRDLAEARDEVTGPRMFPGSTLERRCRYASVRRSGVIYGPALGRGAGPSRHPLSNGSTRPEE